MKPKRIQLRRTRGWRKPPTAIRVSRPSKFGNPFVVSDHLSACCAVAMYRAWMDGEILLPGVPLGSLPQAAKEELRGEDLACWCALDAPCHADVLLEIANS